MQAFLIGLCLHYADVCALLGQQYVKAFMVNASAVETPIMCGIPSVVCSSCAPGKKLILGEFQE